MRTILQMGSHSYCVCPVCKAREVCYFLEIVTDDSTPYAQITWVCEECYAWGGQQLPGDVVGRTVHEWFNPPSDFMTCETCDEIVTHECLP